MAGVLLVSYTHANPDRVLRLRRRLSPTHHLELGAARFFAPGSVTVPSNLLRQEQRAKILEEGLSWLKGIPKRPFGDGVFANSLMYRSVSLWWWLESPFWFGNPVDPSLPPMTNLLEALESFAMLVASAKPERVVFVSDVRSMAALLIQDLADHFGLRFSGSRMGPPGSPLEFLRPSLVRMLLRRRRRFGSRVEGRRVRVLLVSHLNALRSVGGRHQDVYLGPLGEELAKRGVSHSICYVNSDGDARPRFRPFRRAIPEGGFLLEQAISDRPANEVRRVFEDIRKVVRGIEGDFLRSLRWRGIALPRTIRRRLVEALRHHAPSAAYYMSAFEELLRAWEPEVVAISNETGYAGRAAVTACRRLSVRSVGIQHGLISPHHIEYVNDSESMDRKVPWSCPYPDLTALDGHYYQRVLTEMGSYARSETLVTGQLRYEATRLALDAAKGRGHELVVATHPFDRERWITEVLAACGDLGPLMIKPHPLEDRGFYERILRGRPEARVVGDANIMSLMGSAVALVTGFSTTIVEAALAGCPSVLYNPSGGTEPIPFAALGGVVRAESPQELRRVVSEIIEGGEVRRRLEASRESFLGDFAFGGSVDCSKRLADAILKPSRI